MTNGNRARCDRYRQLVRQGDALLHRINPSANQADANCPETADAVNDFLNSGQIRRVRTASGSASYQFPQHTRWTNINLIRTANGLRNCSHIVVRGLRAAGATATAEHYFVVFRVDNVVWVADAYTWELTRGVQQYIDAEAPADRMVTFQRIAGGAYDVIIDDPLADL